MSATLLILITVKATVVLSAAWLVTRAMAHCSAATRHLVWTLAVVAALVLPAVQLVGPRWDLPVLPGGSPPVTIAGAALGSDSIHESSEPLDTRREWGTAGATVVISADPDPAAPAPEFSWPALLAPVWLAGMAFACVRLGTGLVWVRRIMRRAADVTDPRWTVILHEAATALGVNAPVSLKMSADTTIPVACGIGHAVVLLPPDAVEWPEERRRVVLLHEMAHVARRDCLVQALAQLARAVHWFNPFAHLAIARLRAEQERACDDVVLAAGAEASAYADHLLEIACAFRAERCPTWAALAMARPSQLEGRLLAILDDRRARRPPARWIRAAVAVAAGALTLPIGGLQLTAASGPEGPQAPAMTAGERVGAGLALQAGAVPGMAVTSWLDDPGEPPQAPLSPAAVVTAATQFADLLGDVDWDFDFDWYGPVPQPIIDMFRFPDPVPDPDPDPDRDPIADPDSDPSPNPSPNPKPRSTVSIVKPVFGLAGAAKGQAQSQSQSQAQDTAVSDETRRRVADALMTALNDENEDVRERALQALAGMRDARAIPGLVRALSDMSADVRMAALNALAQFSTTEAVDAVLTAVMDSNADVRARAVRHVSALVGRRVLTDGKYVAVFLGLLKDADPGVRVQAITALGRLEQAEAVPALLPLLKDINSDVREQAAAALGDIGDARAVDALTTALKDAEPDVREEAARALGQIARGQRRRAPGTPGPPPPLPRPPRVRIDADAINEMVARAQDAAERQFEYLQRQEEQLQRQQEQIQRQFERLR